ncbi:PP2C family serine/threonine-protein phosphatase [Nonomuraea sp. NPDC050404]|uniref:PP2C family serine/threonine-protein phosphatase n=1 Tax=Nonomuraea sp. NPDC050404 TaxID=3155783 RepID=UPI00341173F8
MSDSAWRLLAASAKGPKKKVNQDYHDMHVSSDGAEVFMAVADGHGSAAYPRSDIGSRLAVEAFLEVVTEFWRSCNRDDQLRHVHFRAKEDLPRDVVHNWRSRVRDHLEREPFTGAVPVGPEIYGTTLLGAVVSEWLVLGWQLGDGELCVLHSDGEPVLPLYDSSEPAGDETYSMCSPGARHLMRLYWAPVQAEQPLRLLTLSTDGLSNSFVSMADYLDFVRGIDRRLSDNGADQVAADLPEWLKRASSYSGDDTTFVGAWCNPRLQEGSDVRNSQVR